MAVVARVARSALSLSIALALAGGANAQTAESEAESKPVQLEAVQVTAQRRVENIQDVPMAISSLAAEKLDAMTASGEDIRFLAARLPSLQIESSFGRAFPRFYIRGLGNTDFDLNASQPVSLVYDDVVQENPILKGFPVFDVEQIEMARGPQGTLFGRNSPAGVIKFNSVRPFGETDGYVRAGWGQRQTMNLEGAVGGALGEGVAARISLLHQRRDDWVDNIHNGPGDDLEGYRESAGRFQLLFSGRDGFEALANVHARALDGTARLFRAGALVPGSNDFVPGFRRDQVSFDAGNEQELDSLGGSLRLRWDFERYSLYSITGYESVEVFSRGDIDGGSLYGFPPDQLHEALFPAESADGLPEHAQWSQELRIESREWGRFDWQAGLYWFDEALEVDSFSFDTLGDGGINGRAWQRQ
ncbi:MAG TPA: TonB-dependent receptor plug domain-containing protein, partial [Arenimonas sp.]|nr:TonB-dependent receptor plug domain-containing protein [Arenimonas sp.]